MIIGVHKHFEIEQDEYCFDVCMYENGASLLKNTVEQAFADKKYLERISGSRQRWLDEPIEDITEGILVILGTLKKEISG